MDKNDMTARGEMSLEQLSADTLKVILSGHWKLGGDLPGADKIQQTLQDRPMVTEHSVRHPEAGLLGHRLVDLPE